jgi:hypothetical protein
VAVLISLFISVPQVWTGICLKVVRKGLNKGFLIGRLQDFHALFFVA